MLENSHLIYEVLHHLRAGRFQISLSLIAGFAGILSGLEVSIEHYRGSYNQKIMYTPVIFSTLLGLAGIAGAFSPVIARTVLPGAGILLLCDGLTGFGFHIRGIARKPGGWVKNVWTNIVMGPPLFAPLLLGVAGALAIVAAMLLPENATGALPPERIETIRKSFAAIAAASAALNGFEVFYSHYQARFANAAQWIPMVLTPPLFLAAVMVVFWPAAGHVPLMFMSLLAILAGIIGTGFHLRGTLRRPGGFRRLGYNLIYGPPAFAPMLFAATGFFGMLAVLVGGTA